MADYYVAPGSTAAPGDPPSTATPPKMILPGMHFHDLRHSYKTWLIEDGIPELAQAKRLGHRLPGIQGIYSHITPAIEQHLVNAPQHRWETTNAIPGGEHTAPPPSPPAGRQQSTT